MKPHEAYKILTYDLGYDRFDLNLYEELRKKSWKYFLQDLRKKNMELNEYFDGMCNEFEDKYCDASFKNYTVSQLEKNVTRYVRQCKSEVISQKDYLINKLKEEKNKLLKLKIPS